MAARLLFAGLWLVADREGRLEDKPKQIKIDVFPGDDVDVEGLLAMLGKTSMLVRYVVDGKRYLQVTNFRKHQNPHRDEKASTIPTPHEHGANTVQTPCSDGGNTVVIGLTPSSLTPDSRLLSPDSSTNTHLGTPPPEREPPQPTSTKAGAVCVVLKSEGVGSVNPSHPELIALIAKGADVGQFSEAAKLAVSKRKPTFAYVLGIVKKQLEDMANMAAGPPGKVLCYETAYQRGMRERVAQFAPGIAKKAPGEAEQKPIVLEAQGVPVAQSC